MSAGSAFVSASLTGDLPADSTIPSPAGATNQRKSCDAVSAVLRKSASIAEIEALDRHIAWFAQLRDQSLARAERTGCFAAQGDADRWELMRLEAVAKREAL
jgi:hypothetical protein